MDIFSKYLYFWSSLIALCVFSSIFYSRKDLRSRMIQIGTGVGIAGFFSESIFFQDYWHPNLIITFGKFGGIEDILFGFAAGGVGTALYDVVFHKRFRKKGHPHFWITQLLIITELTSILVFFYGFKMNSIYASAIGFLIPAIVIIWIRKDLIVETLFSALLGGTLLALLEIAVLIFAPAFVKQYYSLYGKIPLLLGYTPLTEFIWGAAFAAIVGPIYDFKYGKAPVSFTKIKQRKRRSS